MMIGVVSYLPNDDIVRPRRIEAQKSQIPYLCGLWEGAKPVIVAQNYKEEDYAELGKLGSVEYLKYSQGIGPSNARNVLLEKFYASDEDWLLMCDDDSISYPYYQSAEFLKDVHENPKKFLGVDAFMAIEPNYHPFKQRVFEDKANLTHYKFTPRELNSGCMIGVMKNIYKHHEQKLFFDPELKPAEGKGREDIDFLMRWLKLGYSWYVMETWVKKTINFDFSSIFGSDIKSRDKVLRQCLEYMVDKYAKDGMSIDAKGHIVWKDFNARWNKSKPAVYIPRQTAIEFTEKEIPKYKPHTQSRKLFSR